MGEITTVVPTVFSATPTRLSTHPPSVSDGWFATGDIGVLDTDGYLTVTDRKKDIIIRGGENISASEVEDAILHMPGVLEVAVVAGPDERFGERVWAFARVERGVAPLALDDVRAASNARLAKPKWPEGLRNVEDLPRTSSGKVRKNVLRDALREEQGRISR